MIIFQILKILRGVIQESNVFKLGAIAILQSLSPIIESRCNEILLIEDVCFICTALIEDKQLFMRQYGLETFCKIADNIRQFAKEFFAELQKVEASISAYLSKKGCDCQIFYEDLSQIKAPNIIKHTCYDWKNNIEPFLKKQKNDSNDADKAIENLKFAFENMKKLNKSDLTGENTEDIKLMIKNLQMLV